MQILFKSLIFTLLVPGTVTVVIPYWLLTHYQPRLSLAVGLLPLIGVVLIPMGAGGYLWCAWEFSVYGRGTPAVWDPPVRLVATGLYRWVRNPMYLGIMAMLVGEALAFHSLALAVYAFLLGVGFHLFIVSFEEPLLKARFGESYAKYCQTVSRWIPSKFRSPKDR